MLNGAKTSVKPIEGKFGLLNLLNVIDSPHSVAKLRKNVQHKRKEVQTPSARKASRWVILIETKRQENSQGIT